MAKKEEYTLLIPDKLIPVDQRNLVEETLGSEGSLDNQRQSLGSTMARQALQHFLHLPENALHARERSRSPRGEVAAAASVVILPEVHAAEIGPRDAPAVAASSDVEADMPQAL